MKNFIIPSSSTPDNDGLSDYLDQSVEAFSELCDIPVTFFNANHEIVHEYKEAEKICSIFNVYCDSCGPCRQKIASAGEFASRLGEPYIFLCKSRLTNISVALMIDGKFSGYFVAGPIVMGKLKNSVIENFSELNHLNGPAEAFARMYASKMKAYDPTSVTRLSILLYNSIVTSISRNSEYQALRSSNSDQNSINLAIQSRKRANLPIEYPYELEKDLIDSVISGQTELAVENTAKLINAFSIMEAGDIDGIKNNIIWLLAIIIRSATESDNNIEQILDTDFDIINRLHNIDTLPEMLDLSKSLVETITKNMLSSIYNGNSQVITRALRYINRNYKDKITLKDIESNLHINASYFSTLFKQEMGMTFTDYLNSLKIQYACSLLENTNLSIIDVSLSAGFDDQSYFTKVFKKVKGVTPKAWKSQHMEEHLKREK